MRLIWFLLIALITASCGAELPPSTAAPTSAPPPTITPTTEWFPPTETPTPLPTVETIPTQDMRPGIGEIMLEDDFSDPEKWSLTTTASTSAAIANNKLTLALSRPKTTLLTTRLEPSLTNFYAEISASPNLCSPSDEFGIIVRASASFDHFRFGLTCDGRARVDRIRGGTQNVFQTPNYFGAIPNTLLTERRIAVWAVGEDLRFFVNGQLIYTVRDTAFYRGAFGVYVKTAVDGGISVNFSDLDIYQVSQ